MRWFKHEDGWINSAHVVRISRAPGRYGLHLTNGDIITVDSLILHDHVKLIEHEQAVS